LEIQLRHEDSTAGHFGGFLGTREGLMSKSVDSDSVESIEERDGYWDGW